MSERNAAKKADLIENLRINEHLLSTAKLQASPMERDRLIQIQREKIAAAEAKIGEIQKTFETAPARVVQYTKHLDRARKELAEYLNAPELKELERLAMEMFRRQLEEQQRAAERKE